MAESIRIDGLDEFVQSLAAVNADEVLRTLTESTGEAIVADAKQRIPVKSGGARASIRGEVTPEGFTVTGGGSKAPYFGWLEYGGRAGHVDRARVTDGRYIGAAYKRREPQLTADLEAALVTAVEAAGIEVN